MHDFVNRCASLGVWPHPNVMRACGCAARPLNYPTLDSVDVLPPFKLSGAHLSAPLPSTETVNLQLGGYVYDTGSVQALAWALSACKSLANVRLFKLCTSADNWRTLIAALAAAPSLTSVSIDYAVVSTPDAVVPWADLLAAPNLRSVYLRGDAIGDAEAADIFSKLKDKTSLLHLGENRIGDEGIAALGQALVRALLFDLVARMSCYAHIALKIVSILFAAQESRARLTVDSEQLLY